MLVASSHDLRQKQPTANLYYILSLDPLVICMLTAGPAALAGHGDSRMQLLLLSSVLLDLCNRSK